MEFIDLKSQYRRYQAEIDQRIKQVLEHGRYIMGPEIEELEGALAAYVGGPHCVTVASGTDSLELALRALDIGPGDEVVTVPFTFIATAEVIRLVGATPVFVDIEPGTYNLDATKLEAAITPRAKAIIPVSLFGQMANLEAVNAIADKYGIPVIEDAAQSFGAMRNGRRSCGVTRVSSTSFFPAKPFGCYGDGGAVFTTDDTFAATVRAMRNHGAEQRDEHVHVGMNGRFDSIQAAVLLAKLPHFEWELEQRQRIGARYSEALGDVCDVPTIAPGNTHVYAQYTIRVDRRDSVRATLRADRIPTAVYYPKCLHQQPVFADLKYGEGSFPVAERAASEVVSLPMHPFLDEHQQDLIVASVRKAVTG